MNLIKCTLAALIVSVLTLVWANSVFAQLPGVKDTPFDTNTWKEADLFNKNSSASKAIDSAMGGRYTVTLRNPTKNPIFYSINGQQQIGLTPGYKVTLTGVGTPKIRFDIGRGDGTDRVYTLSSGQTYHFEYRRQSAVGATAGGSFLDLFRD